jgi:hypothetical protein
MRCRLAYGDAGLLADGILEGQSGGVDVEEDWGRLAPIFDVDCCCKRRKSSNGGYDMLTFHVCLCIGWV